MTRAEAEAAIREAMARLRHPCPDFQFDTVPIGDATPHVEGDGPEFDWVVSERGQERDRRRVTGEELVFIALESMTCSLAQREELETRTTRKPAFWRKARACVDDNYSRQTWMEAHERLMRFLRQDWGVRVHHKYEAVLQRYPLTPQERANARRLDLSGYGLGKDD